MKDTQSITADGGPYGTVWHLMENGTHKGKWQMVLQFRVNNFRINAFDTHMEFGLSSTHGGTWNHLAGLDEPYYVTIAGFF